RPLRDVPTSRRGQGPPRLGSLPALRRHRREAPRARATMGRLPGTTAGGGKPAAASDRPGARQDRAGPAALGAGSSPLRAPRFLPGTPATTRLAFARASPALPAGAARSRRSRAAQARSRGRARTPHRRRDARAADAVGTGAGLADRERERRTKPDDRG